ncbi:MAG: hypothetical protein BWK79_10340 [Beggiatoa sp. IS2]|nr:MAG: hypothetical protein BWK79_10340 [Beggiatoa sp. IS2]
MREIVVVPGKFSECGGRVKKLIISVLCTFIISCGFQLRGDAKFNFTSLYLQVEAAPRVAQAVAQILQEKGVKIVATPQEAQIVLYLGSEAVENRTLSVSAVSGKIEEVELNVRTNMEIRKPDGKVLSEKQTISLLRDYSFDEMAVLAMGTEAEVLQEEMFREIVAQVIRRLQVIK